jgi:putative membrane protein
MAVAAYPFKPWCGSPPDPSWIWSAWRLDPLVLTALTLLFVWLVRVTARTAGHRTPRDIVLLTSGWVIGTLALISPLCPLSVALFSARASQHVLLTMVAAPLVAAGLAGTFRALPARKRGRSLIDSPLVAAFVFAIVVWFWHAPVPYVFTFDNAVAYWGMHVTMFASATWLWLWLTAARSCGSPGA